MTLILFSLAFEGDRKLEEYPRLAQLMERYGFYSMQIYEHLPYKPAWPIAFHAAQYTKRMRIGPVTIPVFLYRPETVARYLGLLDELSGGRALLGLSRGAYYELLPQKPERSIAAVKEAVEIISSLLDEGRAAYDGRIFKLSVELNLSWLAGRSVELYVGTSGPKLAEVASGLRAVKGIVVDNLWNRRYVETLRTSVEAGAAGAGRNASEVSIVARPFASISSDVDEARRTALSALRRYLPALVGNSPMLRAAGISYEDLKSFSEYSVPDHEDVILENFSAVGTPEDVIEQTDRIVKAGVGHVCYGHPLSGNIEEGVRLIGEKVKPYFDEIHK